MKKYVYIGCRTTKRLNGTGKGIQVFEVNPFTDDWTHVQTLETEQDPAFLTFDKNKDFLYCVHGDTELASAFRVDKKSGCITYLNTVNLGGKNPVYAIPDKTNQFILFACLDGGMVCAARRNADGSLGQTVYHLDLPGKDQGKPSSPHMITYDNRERFLVVPAKGGRGLDCGALAGLNVLTFDPERGFEQVFALGGRNVDECRHVAFHPNGEVVYLLNEKRSLVISLYMDKETGAMKPFQVSQTLPDDCVDLDPKLYTAGIGLTSDGRYLYVTNRGHDSIAMFKVDSENGRLAIQGWMPCGGRFPWAMEFAENDSILYVANAFSSTIVPFRVGENGMLEATNKNKEVASPSYMIFS